MLKRLLIVCCSGLLLAGTAIAQAPAGQGEYKPVDQLPPADQLPAAPLLIAAYAVAWVAILFYVWTIWRRLQKVEGEMHALERRSKAR